ncbi:MAG: helix-turn-helix transcriptional regulator [Lachnospiraceae bacterium]|nr:helix-turn-helix transcriptional regulator [Lachnospiraceae bacterium]
MAYYSRLRDLREDNDLSQKEVAKQVHVSQRSYSHYEKGDRTMPIDVLERLAAYYNTSMDYLVERTDVKKAYPPGKNVQS